MSVRLDGDAIVLAGRCSAQDAEALLLALQDYPGATVDLDGVQGMHMAVLQLLLATMPQVRGRPASPFLAEIFSSHLIWTSDKREDFS